MAEYVIKGSDIENASVQLLDDGVAIDLSDATAFPYDAIEVHLVDEYYRVKAKYKTPTTAGFEALDITTDPENGMIYFNILASDSTNFTLGALYAMVVLIDTTREGFAGGYRFALDKMYLGETKENKI